MNEDIKKFKEELELEWNTEKEKYDATSKNKHYSQFYLKSSAYITWRQKVRDYVKKHFKLETSEELLSLLQNSGIVEDFYEQIKGILDYLATLPIEEIDPKINLQKKAKEIIILTGAGISNLFGLPMASGFTSLIGKNLQSSLKELLSDYLGDGIYDIEKIMFALEDCLDKENISLQEHILNTGKYFPDERLSSSNPIRVNFNEPVKRKYQEIKNNMQEYLLHLKTGIYKILNDFDTDKASTLYYNILAQIKTKCPDSLISIFTTNYDLSFERACRSNKENLKNIKIYTDIIDYGFVLQDGIMVFDTTSERKYLEYYKLHGSLDWHYDDLSRCTKSGANASPSLPDTMPILYPGVKGKPKKEPFIKLHNIFFERLQNADLVIVLGFAFRDPYINDLINFSRKINGKYKMLYFNPIKKENLPKESGIYEFVNLFGEDLKYVESKIEIKDNPLGDFLEWGIN